MDILPASECVINKPSDTSAIPHMDLDHSEVSEDKNASCVSISTDTEGIFSTDHLYFEYLNHVWRRSVVLSALA